MTEHGLSEDHKQRWFNEQPLDGQIPEASKRLLETYSKVPSDEVVKHVVDLRNEAWEIFPYPCIGQFRFLEPGITDLEEYNEVIKRLSQGQTLLDMACCFGQTVRQLVADGAPAENITGCDLEPDFIKLGYKLFKDEDKLQSNFLTADIFDDQSSLVGLKGQFDMVYAGSFFHLWGLEKQRQVSKRVALLLRPQAGSMILGRQIAAEKAEERLSGTWPMFRHNVDSFKQLWKEIGEDMGVSFKVEADLRRLSRDHFGRETGDDTRRIFFTIRRE